MSDFDKAFKYTVGNEGSYSNDRNDSGGPTKYGITQADLSSWLGHPASIQEVKDMSLATAKSIYKKRYWDSLDLDEILNTAVGTCMFDIGVVRGISVPPKYAQEICNEHGAKLIVDSHMGPLTLSSINQMDATLFVTDFSHFAEAGFRSIVAAHPSQRVFLKGWVNRARRLLTLV